MSCVVELEIQAAWGILTSKPKTVWLSPSGRVTVAGPFADYSRLSQVGVFTQSIPLADFRAEVFHVWEEMRR